MRSCFPDRDRRRSAWARRSPINSRFARTTFAEADAALGESLSDLIFNGPADRLTLTENTQPAILTMSIAVWRLLESRGLTPSFVAGHSLGEYSAHVAAGTLAFADAVRLVRNRGRYMQEAVPVGAGAMAAILGLDEAGVNKACEEAAQGEVVSPANLNGAGPDRDCRQRRRGGARRSSAPRRSAPSARFRCR